MATTQAVPQESAVQPQAVVNGAAIGTTTQESRVTIKYVENEKDENGNEQPVNKFVVLAEDQAQKRLEELNAKGKQAEIAKIRTFIYHEVGSRGADGALTSDPLVDFMSLVPDKDAQANIINRGYVLRQQQILRDYMLDDQETSTQENVPFDLLNDAAQKTERAKASPEEKALKAVLKAADNMSGEDAQKFLALLQQQFMGKVTAPATAGQAPAA